MTDAVPAWVDMPTLCREICATPPTVEAWIAKGVLPPARKRGGKLMWKWREVDEWLTNGPPVGQVDWAQRVYDGTQAKAS